MYTGLTRAIQRHYGHPLGAAALLWATRDKPPVLGKTLHCPRCSAAMTLTEELERRRRKRGA